MSSGTGRLGEGIPPLDLTKVARTEDEAVKVTRIRNIKGEQLSPAANRAAETADTVAKNVDSKRSKKTESGHKKHKGTHHKAKNKVPALIVDKVNKESHKKEGAGKEAAGSNKPKLNLGTVASNPAIKVEVSTQETPTDQSATEQANKQDKKKSRFSLALGPSSKEGISPSHIMSSSPSAPDSSEGKGASPLIDVKKKSPEEIQNGLNKILQSADKCFADMKAGEIRELEDGIYVAKHEKIGEHTFTVFKMGRELGKGAFNHVHSIGSVAGPLFQKLGSDFVLKVAKSEHGAQDMQREFEGGEIKLPHVVMTVAANKFVATDGKTHHLVMLQQALKGGDFEEAFIGKPDPTATTGARLSPVSSNMKLKEEGIRQFAQGVAELHENHIIHRDLKPQNAMLQSLIPKNGKKEDVKVKVIDFGTHVNMSKAAANPRATLTWKGTIGYAAPEKYLLQTYNVNSHLIGSQGSTNFAVLGARKMLYADGKNPPIDDSKIEDFHKACDVYEFSVAAFESLFGELPEMAKKTQQAGSDGAFSIALTFNRDKAYKKEEFDEMAKSKGISHGMAELIWAGLDPDPTLRPPIQHFAHGE